MAWTSVVPMEILRSIWILDMFWKKVVFYIAVLTHYYKQWLKTTQLIISVFTGQSPGMAYHWFSASGCHHPEIKVSMGVPSYSEA